MFNWKNVLITANPAPYCRVNPTKTVANDLLCSQYYDCSNSKSPYGDYIQECRYPLLYSEATGQCDDFSNVDCGLRFMPITPCKYSFMSSVHLTESRFCI